MPTYEDKTIGAFLFSCLREIDNFRNVGEVVAGESDDIRPLVIHNFKVILVGFRLEIDEPHVVPGTSNNLSHDFQSQRLKPKEDFRVHERTWMNGEKLHKIVFLLLSWMILWGAHDVPNSLAFLATWMVVDARCRFHGRQLDALRQGDLEGNSFGVGMRLAGRWMGGGGFICEQSKRGRHREYPLGYPG